MTTNTDTAIPAPLLSEAGSDPIEDRLRETMRATIEALFDEELAAFLGRIRYGRGGGTRKGYRHGRRERELVGTFGTETVSVPRARIEGEDGKTSEWRSQALRRYQRLTKRAEGLIAAVYLAGTNTRRVKRALFGLFQGAVGKGVVSRAWRKVKVDWDAWCARSLADEDIVRVILDGTVIRTRLDRKATNISVLAAIGVRRDGQKILLSIRHMGGESTSAWRQFLDDLDARGLKRPDFVIVDGAPGLEAALTALWGAELPIQRCTVHKHRNLLGQAGCQWAMLPRDFPPFQTVQYHFYRLRNEGLLDLINDALVAGSRILAGRDAVPTAGIIDSQSVKTTEGGGPRVYDAGKKTKGRKRHIVTDTDGNLLGLVTHSADVQDRDGAPDAIMQALESHSTLTHIFADGGYSGNKLNEAMADIDGPKIEIVKRPPGATGFVVIARRWVVERSFAWMGRCRRLAKDWEASIASADAWTLIAAIRRSARHIARKTAQEF